MLHKYELLVAKEEVEKVDTLRYSWEKLLARGTEVQNQLGALQPNFRGELISNVRTFVQDCSHFYQDYDKVSTALKRQGSLMLHYLCLNTPLNVLKSSVVC